MKRSHRVALKPTPEQESLFSQHAGYARFAYNWAVGEFKAGLDVGEWLPDQTLRPRRNKVKCMVAPWGVELSQNAARPSSTWVRRRTPGEPGQSRYKLVDLAKHTSPRMGRAEGGVMRKGKGASIMDYFETLEDPRIDRCRQVLDMPSIAVICGADSWVYIELRRQAGPHWNCPTSRIRRRRVPAMAGPRQCPT